VPPSPTLRKNAEDGGLGDRFTDGAADRLRKNSPLGRIAAWMNCCRCGAIRNRIDGQYGWVGGLPLSDSKSRSPRESLSKPALSEVEGGEREFESHPMGERRTVAHASMWLGTNGYSAFKLPFLE